MCLAGDDSDLIAEWQPRKDLAGLGGSLQNVDPKGDVELCSKSASKAQAASASSRDGAACERVRARR